MGLKVRQKEKFKFIFRFAAVRYYLLRQVLQALWIEWDLNSYKNI